MAPKINRDVTLKTILSIRKYVIFPLFSVLIVVGVSVFILVPQLRQIIEVRDDLAILKQDKSRLSEKKELLEELSKTTIDEEIEMLTKVLPRNKAVVLWLTLFNDLAKDTGVSIGKYAFKPGSIATESAQEENKDDEINSKETSRLTSNAKTSRKIIEKEKSFQLEMNVSGTIESVREFFNKIEKTAPIVRVSSIILSPRNLRIPKELIADELRQKLVSCDLELALYYAEAPKVIGGITDELPIISADKLKTLEMVRNLELIEEASVSAVKSGERNIFAPF
jgi:hypothetical protein